MKGEWEPFFKENGEYRISVHFYESDNRFTVEQLYQAIKERLKDELVSDTFGTSNYGLLVDRFSGDSGEAGGK